MRLASLRALLHKHRYLKHDRRVEQQHGEAYYFTVQGPCSYTADSSHLILSDRPSYGNYDEEVGGVGLGVNSN